MALLNYYSWIKTLEHLIKYNSIDFAFSSVGEKKKKKEMMNCTFYISYVIYTKDDNAAKANILKVYI